MILILLRFEFIIFQSNFLFFFSHYSHINLKVCSNARKVKGDCHFCAVEELTHSAVLLLKIHGLSYKMLRNKMFSLKQIVNTAAIIRVRPITITLSGSEFKFLRSWEFAAAYWPAVGCTQFGWAISAASESQLWNGFMLERVKGCSPGECHL